MVDIWGLAAIEWESFVPADTSFSIFSEKPRSGDVGERERECDDISCDSGVPEGWEGVLSFLWSLSTETSLGVDSQSSCSEVCGQGSA